MGVQVTWIKSTGEMKNLMYADLKLWLLACKSYMRQSDDLLRQKVRQANSFEREIKSEQED